MEGYSVIIVIFIFFASLLATSRFFYQVELRAFSRKKAKELELDILNLAYSFEQMVYFIALPSQLEEVKNVKRENLSIEFDYTSIFFPCLSGIQIVIKSERDKKLLAYLPIKDFRLPTLDIMLENEEINKETYLKISTFKLIHRKTLKEIVDEVYKQLHAGRQGMEYK